MISRPRCRRAAVLERAKVAKFKGDFVWHQHDDTDELFLCLQGELLIELRDGSPTGLARPRSPRRGSDSLIGPNLTESSLSDVPQKAASFTYAAQVITPARSHINVLLAKAPRSEIQIPKHG
jgi:hypothetical protein